MEQPVSTEKVGAEKQKLSERTTYHIGNRSFVVEPVFKKEGENTLGRVLLRLMKSENEKP